MKPPDGDPLVPDDELPDDEPDDVVDPDWDYVPEALRDLAGQPVVVVGQPVEGGAAVGPPVMEDSTLVIIPGLWGHAARLWAGFYDEEDDDGA